MTIGKGKRPRDTNQFAKFVVDVTTAQIPEPDPYHGKNSSKVDAGRKGGIKGGKVRAEKMPSASEKRLPGRAQRSVGKNTQLFLVNLVISQALH